MTMYISMDRPADHAPIANRQGRNPPIRVQQ